MYTIPAVSPSRKAGYWPGRAAQELGQGLDVGPLGREHGPDLAEGPLGGVPEDGAGQRVEEAAAELEGHGLVEGEAQARLGLGGVETPAFEAVLADGLFHREAGLLEGVEVAADGLLADGEFLGQFLD